MATVLQYSPGAQATILLQTLNDVGVREDGYSSPVVSRVILPDFSESTLYPINMVRLDTGLYYHRFTIPSGSIGVGTYIVDLSWTNAAGDPKQDIIQVICVASGGSFSVSPN